MISASGTASCIEPAAMARPLPGVSLSLGWRTHSPHLLRFSADQRRSIRLIRLNAAAPASAAAPAIIAATAINAAELRSSDAAALNQPTPTAVPAEMVRWPVCVHHPAKAPPTRPHPATNTKKHPPSH